MINGNAKGKAFEREIARSFREDLGFEDVMTKREARGGDWSHTDDGVDLVGTAPFVVSCKRYKDYAPISKMDEIKPMVCCPEPKDTGYAACVSETCCMTCNQEMASHPEAVPIMLTKANNKPTMAVLPWAELKRLIRAAYPQDGQHCYPGRGTTPS